MIYIGIDAGKNTGIAIVLKTPEGLEIFETRLTDFWGAVKLLESLNDNVGAEVSVVLEMPSYNRVTFSHGERRAQIREKISRDVGANSREAELLLIKCEELNLRVHTIRPTRSKWDAAECRARTGYNDKPNNEHVRDAIRLVFEYINPVKIPPYGGSNETSRKNRRSGATPSRRRRSRSYRRTSKKS